MNPIYEAKNSATTIYLPKEQTTVLHNGSRYKLMGESLGQEFSRSQKLKRVMSIVVLVAATIFTRGLILFGLAIPAVRFKIIKTFKELKAGSQINLHYVLQKPEQWQKDAFHPFIERLKWAILYDVSILPQLTCASCFISIHYNHGKEIQGDSSRLTRQFLFKNEDDSPLTKAELIQKIENVEKEVGMSIKKEIDVATTKLVFSCTLLHQDSPENLVKASYVNKDTHAPDGVVKGLLKNVGVYSEEVLSKDGKQILLAGYKWVRFTHDGNTL